MQSMGLMFDVNLMQALGITAILVGVSIVYLMFLSTMIKSKYWPVAMIMFVSLFVFTHALMIEFFQDAIPTDVKPYLIMLLLKFLVISHGIYFITIELGRFQGLRTTVISLEEHEIFIVLFSISITNLMVNLHTLQWNPVRFMVIVAFNILFIHLAVKIVFYIGEFKYYLIYGVPMLLAYILQAVLNDTYVIEHAVVASETQVAIISTLVIATVYLFVTMRFEMVDSRSLVRQYKETSAKRHLKSDNNEFKFKSINDDIDKRLDEYNKNKDKNKNKNKDVNLNDSKEIDLNKKITNAINEREIEKMKDKENNGIHTVNNDESIKDKSLEQLEKELVGKLKNISNSQLNDSLETKDEN